MACLAFHFGFLNYKLPKYGSLRPSKFYNISAVYIIAEMLDINIVDKNIQVFLSEDESKAANTYMSRFKNPVSIQTTAGCSANKNWPLANWEKLVRSLPEYTFIQLGDKNETPVAGAVNMLGRPLRESFALIKNSKSFVGIDSCLAHASNAFSIPGVVLYGTSNSDIWGHSNNINLSKNLRCSPCIDILLGDPCPYKKPCMDISVSKVKEALIRQIGSTY